jgi:uncharacterized protein
MELPQEIEAFYTIPAVRRELTRALVAAGLTQRQIAKKLDVTEAAVSQYLSNKRGTQLEYPPEVVAAMTAAASRIKTTEDTTVIRKEILELIKIMKEQKVICQIHKKHGFDKDGCTACFD